MQRRTDRRRGTVRGVNDHISAKTTPELLEALDDVRRAPRDLGSVLAIVRRPAVDQRELVLEADLDVEEGVVGDTWRRAATGTSQTALPIRWRRSRS